MFLFLFSFLSIATAAPWICDGLKELDLTNGPAWVPFKSEKAEPYSPTNMSCLWRLSIPDGMYASVKVNANFDKDDMFMLYNNLGYKHLFRGFNGDLSEKLNTTFYLPADSVGSFIELNSKGYGQGYLTFEVQLFNLPNLPPQEIVLIGQSVTPLANLATRQFVYNSPKEYIFRVATDDYSYKYDSCFIYDSNSEQDVFVSGLSKQIDGVPTRFAGKTTVICLDVDFPDSFIVAAPVPASLGDKSSWSIRTGESIVFSLYSRTLFNQKFQPAILTTYCPGGCSEYLQSVNYLTTENGTLSLNSGSPVTGLTPLESFLLREGDSHVPQRMAGEWKTYISTNGDSFVDIDRKNEKYETVSSSRKGFFASANYGVPSANQAAVTNFTSSSGTYAFSYKVEDVSNASVVININQGGGQVYTKTITSVSKDVSATEVFGQSMSIEISQVGATSKGALVSYEFVKASSTGITVLATIIFCLLRL